MANQKQVRKITGPRVTLASRFQTLFRDTKSMLASQDLPNDRQAVLDHLNEQYGQVGVDVQIDNVFRWVCNPDAKNGGSHGRTISGISKMDDPIQAAIDRFYNVGVAENSDTFADRMEAVLAGLDGELGDE